MNDAKLIRFRAYAEVNMGLGYAEVNMGLGYAEVNMGLGYGVSGFSELDSFENLVIENPLWEK